MMRTLRKIAAAAMCVLVCVFLVSCGKKEASYDDGGYYEPKEDYGNYNSPAYYGDGDVSYAPSEPEFYGPDAGKNAELYGLKMTYRAEIHLETLDAEKCEAELMKAIADCGGYISAQVSEGGYTTTYGDYVSRYSRVTVKVPADKLDKFLSGMDGYANVTSVTRSAEDITAQYTDTEARLSSLQAQKARLEELMSQAGSLTELLEVEERLAHVIYEIESYTAQMNNYKDLVAFSTVTVYLNEVTTVTRQTVTFIDRLKAAFANTWHNFVSFLGDAVIGFVDILPYILLLALLAFFVIRKAKKIRARRMSGNGGNGGSAGV